MNTTKEQDLQKIGQDAFEAIAEMVAALECDYDRLGELREAWTLNEADAEELKELKEAAGDCESEDDAKELIEDDPLSLRIFGEKIDGEWDASNYEILLDTGGPAVRIVGDLEIGEATSARLEIQDWYTPWTEFHCSRDVLLAYVACFYLGE